jgi:hypothetical protein
MTADEEGTQRVSQTIRATKSMLMASFNPKEFAITDLLPHNTSFTAVYFVNNMMLSLANLRTEQLEDIGCRKLHPHFNNSYCHIARHIQEQMASHRCVFFPTPVFSRRGRRRLLPIWPAKATTV